MEKIDSYETISSPAGFNPGASAPASGRTLVVILHGWHDAPADLLDVQAATREALMDAPGVDLFVPPLAYRRWYSFASPTVVAARLLADVDLLCADEQRYAGIFLIGHGIGAVIVRRMFLIAAGMNRTVPSEGALAIEPARPWASRVRRIISLAGLNRGWVGSGRLGLLEAIGAMAVSFAGHLWPGTRTPTLFQMRRGSPFIVHTRLQWLALLRDPAKPKPAVVQLLGTQDNLVAPDDAVDFAVDGMMNTDYLYIELPNTNHADAKAFSPNDRDPDGQHGACRKRLFSAALADDLTALNERCVTRAMLADTLPPKPDESVEEVVFVIPGIHDDGYWARGIAQRIRQTAAKYNRPANAYRSIMLEHGFFGIFSLILPRIARAKVECLMDAYVDAASSYPRARFSYVGPANRTCLLTRALRDYPAIRFRNVLLAGNAARLGNGADRLIATGRVSRVLNMVEARDWFVTISPVDQARPYRFDPRGSDFRSFDQGLSEPGSGSVRFVTGGHGGGLMETQWPRIAEFIVNDAFPRHPDPRHRSGRLGLGRWIASLSPGALVLILIVLLFGVAVPFLLPDVIPALAGSPAMLWLAATFVYALLVWLVVTRV